MKTIAVLLAALVGTAGAADLPNNEAAALEKNFFATQRATRTLACDFTQSVSTPGLPAPVVSRGRLIYRAPDDLRITYAEPAGELLQLDSTAFTTVRAGPPALRRSPDHASARALHTLREVLRGQRPAGEMNARVTRQDGRYIVVLTPATPGGFQPERIENTIDASSMLLRSLSITLPRGTVMRFDFSNLRRNRPLTADAFALP